MSSDLYVLDAFFDHHPTPEIVSPDGGDLFFPDPFSPFCDSSIDILQEFSNNQCPLENSNSVDSFSPSVLSSSPPSHQLENLGIVTYWLGCFGGETEECQLSFESSYNHIYAHDYSSVENVAKMMQRSYSSNSFEGKPGFLFQPRFDTLLESPNYQSQALSLPENDFLAGQLRRACSTGDLQNINRAALTAERSFSSPLATESSFIEESNFKVGRYSAEERKERISKYRAKRGQRNFTKTIKYACRKTLADNRPRIRGRFARNEETSEIPKMAFSTRDEDEEEQWFDGLHEEEDDGAIRGSSGGFVNSFIQPRQFQYYGY
uniref:CCT domain-containing protein n=1 Tax=Salix viminalis TaxID=40686 RepID=A0A6N2MD97_SALVM